MQNVTDYEVVTNSVQITNQNQATVSVNAPTGKRVLGGGGRISAYGTSTNVGAFLLMASAPTSGETGWQCEWFSPNGQNSATFVVTALCANV